MYTLYLKSNNTLTKLNTLSTDKQIFQYINQYLKDNNIKSYYMRLWSRDNQTYIDYGSHVDFFVVEPVIV